ncbi:MAG: hypothetical protein ACLPZY_05080, partial [Terracidiphilus sp.]
MRKSGLKLEANLLQMLMFRRQRLDVEAQEVVRIQAGARSRWIQFKAGVWSVEVVLVQPEFELLL